MRTGWLRQPGYVAAAGLLALAGCATVPRGPAGKLADSGIATTNALASDVRATSANVRDVEIWDSFSATYAICSNPRLTCAAQLKSGPNALARDALVAAIAARADAVDGLNQAYSALKTEADYDARADLVGATNQAIGGVNRFAAAIAAAPGAGAGAALISAPLQQLAGLGAGLLADRAQAKRLRRASAAIAVATQRFRDAFGVEARVFDSLAGYIELNRTAAQLALLDSGLGSNQELAQAFSGSLGLKAIAGVDPLLIKSPAAKAALHATVAAQSRREVERVRGRYRAGLNALDGLLKSHHDFEAGQPLSLSDVDRFLGELNAALTPAQEKK